MDRLKQYFTDKLDDMFFVELSPEFVDKAGAGNYLRDVPVPIHKRDLPGFAGGKGMETAKLGERMAEVIGCDPEFRYSENYLAFLKHAFDDKLIEVLLGRAAGDAEKGKLRDACIQYRAALALDENNAAALFGYARTCQDIYIESEDDEEIGNFKAESLDRFEEMTIKHPETAEGHYYLGYAYVNMGLYMKAQIAWKEFIRLREEEIRRGADPDDKQSGAGRDDALEEGNRRVPDDVTEIRERLEQLKDPVEIEKGCNHIIAGRYEEGAEILERFTEGPHGSWWPMHFYLGTAYREMGRPDDAIESFRKVLRYNAVHADSMQELVELYRETGNTDMEEKYRKKLSLISGM